MDSKQELPNVFQLWYSFDDKVPEIYNSFIDHNKGIFNKIPSYRLITTSEINDFLKKHDYDLSKFKKFNFKFQSDIIRFLILYHYGGLYLDLDIKVNDNFLDLLNELTEKFNDCDAMPENWRIYFLWFQKGSENLKTIIDFYMSLEFLDYDYNIFSLGGLSKLVDIKLIPLSKLDMYLKHFVMSG